MQNSMQLPSVSTSSLMKDSRPEAAVREQYEDGKTEVRDKNDTALGTGADNTEGKDRKSG